jgi:hypothetical protein
MGKILQKSDLHRFFLYCSKIDVIKVLKQKYWNLM